MIIENGSELLLPSIIQSIFHYLYTLYNYHNIELTDEDTTKGKDHEALEGPMTKGRLKQAQHVIEIRLVICIAAIDDD